ncbi:hypothetical protein R84B8_02500 [Treponema sp. R8-4-B8]
MNYSRLLEQIFNEKLDWFEDISEAFNNFAESISNAVIGESPSFNEAPKGESNYFIYLLKAEENYFHINTKLDFFKRMEFKKEKNNHSKNELLFINFEAAPSVCAGINSNTDRMRRFYDYLNSEDNEFKNIVFGAAIMVYKEMLNALRDSLELYNRSVSTPVPIPEAF